MKTCPSCSRTFPETKRFCGHCGTALPDGAAPHAPAPSVTLLAPVATAAELHCPSCGKALLKTSAKFCRFCGASLTDESEPLPVTSDTETTPPLFQESETQGGIPRWLVAVGAVGVIVLLLAVSSDWWASSRPTPPPVAVRTDVPRPPAAPSPRPGPRATAADTVRDPANLLREGLVVHYPFEGSLEDKSGSGNHGTALEFYALTSNNAFSGQSLQCGGADCVTVPPSPAMRLEQFTLAVWVLQVNFNFARIMSYAASSESFYLQLTNRSRPTIGFHTGPGFENLVSPVGLDAGRWHFVAATYDGTRLRLYLDESPAAEKLTTGRPNQSSSELEIGYGSRSDRFQFLLDELRIYRRALAPQEVTELYRRNLADRR